MACSAALRWMASVTICRARCAASLARFGLEPLDQVGGVAPRVGFDLAEQHFFGFVGGEPGQPLQLALLIGDEPLVAGGRFLRGFRPHRDRLIAAAQVLFGALRDGGAIGQGARLFGQRLFEPRSLDAPFARLALGLDQQLVRALLAGEDRFLQLRVGVALALPANAIRLLLRAADGLGGDASAVGHPIEQHRAAGQQAEQHVDEGDEPEVAHLGHRCARRSVEAAAFDTRCRARDSVPANEGLGNC